EQIAVTISIAIVGNQYFIQLNHKNEELQQETTARKQAEETLRKNERKYRALADSQGEGVGIANEKDQILFANPAAEKIFGVPAGTLEGRNLREFVDEKNRRVIESQTQIRRHGEQSTYEMEIVRDDGRLRHLLVTATAKTDQKGEFEGTIGIMRDITERKRAEEELRKSKVFQRVLLQSSPDFIFVLNNKGIIQKANRIHADHKKEDVIGKSAEMFVPPRYQGIFRKAFEQVLVTRQLQTVETEVDLPDGKHIILCRMNPMSFDDDEMSIVFVGTDITVRKQAELQRELLLGELKRANKDLEDFAFVVSHDLRDPLRGISTAVGRLFESYAEALDDKGREYLRQIEGRAQRLHNLIEGILRHSRLGRTKGIPE
ncbi:MAG: PAS domain S-box protein, partial [Deltaproteobacteria bacterium]|nr:PAS domain S-box protein [Deltaproteobacteria bacterium]